MSKMVQVRNVPDRLHRELARRAAARGQTMTAYIQDVLEREIARPSWDDWLAEIRRRGPVAPEIPSGELIRAGRREAGRD